MAEAEEARPAPQRVLLGVRVELELVDSQGRSEALTVDLVDEAGADIDSGRLGLNTPLAKALIGRTAGSRLPYTMGDIRHLLIRRLSWAPAIGEDDEAAAAARRAAVDEARRRAAKTLTDNVATSMNNKWGSYEVPDAE